MTNAETATSATNVAAINDAVEALANAEDDDPAEVLPLDLPPLPLVLLLAPDLPPADLMTVAAEEEADALPDDDSEDESRSLFLSFSLASSSSVFSQ